MRTDNLRPQDVLVACKLLSIGESRAEWSYSSLALAVGLSQGEVHNAVERCRLSQVLPPSGFEVCRKPLCELLSVVVPRIYFPARGGLSRGMLTGSCAPPLRDKLAPRALGQVWPRAEGPDQGEGVLPIYPSVPEACSRDALVYELLALSDVMRVGSVLERRAAASVLEKRILGK